MKIEQRKIWELIRRQHGVVSRQQLIGLGVTSNAIQHRMVRGRLRPVATGVYAVGRPALTECGQWMAAVLCCGDGVALSDTHAGALWEMCPASGPVEVSAPTQRSRPGIVVRRRRHFEVTEHRGIPVTTPVFTLVHLAAALPPRELEAAVNAADKLDLVSSVELREQLDHMPRIPGLRKLRNLLDRHTFVLTDSELERTFLPIARSAGLGTPETGEWLHGFKTDFHWPDLGLVVETDGLRYHRTAAQQTRDQLREQELTAAGLTPLRFTHWQVADEPHHVRRVLARVARRLASAPRSPS